MAINVNACMVASFGMSSSMDRWRDRLRKQHATTVSASTLIAALVDTLIVTCWSIKQLDSWLPKWTPARGTLGGLVKHIPVG